MNIIRTIAYLTTMTTRTVGLRDHQQIILAIVLDDTRTLQESRLIFLTLEDTFVGTLDDIAQVLLQLHHLACAIDDIHTVVIVEEQ